MLGVFFMPEPENTVATTLKTTFVAGSGLVVWGLSLNEWAAILSIVLLVTTICEKWGVTGWVQRKIFKKKVNQGV